MMIFCVTFGKELSFGRVLPPKKHDMNGGTQGKYRAYLSQPPHIKYHPGVCIYVYCLHVRV